MTVDRAIEPADARLAGATAWDAEADDVLVCRALRDETHDVDILAGTGEPGSSQLLSSLVRHLWSYGIGANRKTLETFLRHHHSQGLSSRLVKVEELFHPGTLESFKI